MRISDWSSDVCSSDREHRRGRSAVTRMVVGFGRDSLDHLRAHILELVFQFDFLRDGDAILGDARCAETLVDQDVAALGAERHADRVGENIDTARDTFARVTGEFYVLRSEEHTSELQSL